MHEVKIRKSGFFERQIDLTSTPKLNADNGREGHCEQYYTGLCRLKRVSFAQYLRYKGQINKIDHKLKKSKD